jgi:cell wall-associated NlpC family hydrolase
MMNKAEFINSVVGKPWVRASDSLDNGGVDCWGLVRLSFESIDEINLPEPPWRMDMDIARSAKQVIDDGGYVKCREKEGAIWLVTTHDGAAVHIGRILNGYAVHADGSTERAGHIVAADREYTFRRYRIFGLEIEFYEYKGCDNGTN